jgi:hypothetical protein
MLEAGGTQRRGPDAMSV